MPAFGEVPRPAVEAAVKAVAAGLPIGIPTDTVYGLAVDPFIPGAGDRLFELKRRPRDVSLPVLVGDVDQALSLSTAVSASARTLMDRFWPGALTIVLRSRPDLGADLGDERSTIGVRCPAHVVPRTLCHAVGALATTSANLHGQPTLITAADVARTFGDAVAVVLDAGRCEGAPSTVVDCTGGDPKLLREGRLPWETVRAALEEG